MVTFTLLEPSQKGLPVLPAATITFAEVGDYSSIHACTPARPTKIALRQLLVE
jgi:hypothetical protein